MAKNGTCFPTEYWAHPLQQPSTPTAYVVTIQDLTDKHAANDVLRQSEEKFRRILANVPDVAWTSDRDGQTIYISPKVEAILGYTNRESVPLAPNSGWAEFTLRILAG